MTALNSTRCTSLHQDSARHHVRNLCSPRHIKHFNPSPCQSFALDKEPEKQTFFYSPGADHVRYHRQRCRMSTTARMLEFRR
ncbi:hypothetical protein PAMC26510_11520 [Caballeronia sordidicola]|uniref:Uncharacterized protein n=1 Tax=Caballeronia sordidicola TaxID=196367 RepID=A0A242MXX1_CABSO|nr:hypothetical protein PAMC26510_11520 [Caballeronia sordidicola]